MERYKAAYDEFIKLYPFNPEDLPDEVWKVIPNYDLNPQAASQQGRLFVNRSAAAGGKNFCLFIGSRLKHLSPIRIICPKLTIVLA